jgi:hypothetical protein
MATKENTYKALFSEIVIVGTIIIIVFILGGKWYKKKCEMHSLNNESSKELLVKLKKQIKGLSEKVEQADKLKDDINVLKDFAAVYEELFASPSYFSDFLASFYNFMHYFKVEPLHFEMQEGGKVVFRGLLKGAIGKVNTEEFEKKLLDNEWPIENLSFAAGRRFKLNDSEEALEFEISFAVAMGKHL